MLDLSNTANIRFIDLTHTLHQDIPQWLDGCGFRNKIHSDYNDGIPGEQFRVQYLEMMAGIGTHMDAPSHRIVNGANIDEIPLANLIRPCVVINVAGKAHERYQCSVEDIQLFEQKYGTISSGTLVIIHTGWGRYWNTPDKYRNNLLFPSVSVDAANLLLSRGIVGIGIDTLSPDINDSDFPVHQIFLGNNKFILENIANSEQLPETGAFIIALPIKISGGTESPIRLVGVINSLKD